MVERICESCGGHDDVRAKIREVFLFQNGVADFAVTLNGHMACASDLVYATACSMANARSGAVDFRSSNQFSVAAFDFS